MFGKNAQILVGLSPHTASLLKSESAAIFTSYLNAGGLSPPVFTPLGQGSSARREFSFGRLGPMERLRLGA